MKPSILYGSIAVMIIIIILVSVLYYREVQEKRRVAYLLLQQSTETLRTIEQATRAKKDTVFILSEKIKYYEKTATTKKLQVDSTTNLDSLINLYYKYRPNQIN